MNVKNLGFLLFIAKKVGINKSKLITTIAIAKEFQISQQSVSRKLKEFEIAGFITRESSLDGVVIRLTKLTKKTLKECYELTNAILKAKNKYSEINGSVFSGLGEGRFYTQLKPYKNQFIEKLKINPFPGTLNLNIKENDKIRFISEREPIIINGFKTEDRTYGDIKCYLIKLNQIDSAVVIPDRTIHKNTLEIISNEDLRKKLTLKDNDKVIIE